jgi:hypothetical protein
MNKPLQTISFPPSPSVDDAATNRDIAANHRFPSGPAVRQTATRAPHADRNSGSVQTHARRTAAPNETQRFRRWFSALLATALLVHPSTTAAHVAGCHTRKCDRRVHQHRVQKWCLHHARCVWKHRWHAEEASWKNWLRHTANCESGNRAHIATGNGYYGLTQFDLATWHEAGGHGYPHQATWYEQAVRSIELAKRVGTGRWPVCGH